MKKKENDISKKTYVLTCDLGEKIKSLNYIGLKTPKSDDSFYADFKKELSEKIGKSMPGCTVKVVSMKDLAEEILSKAFNKIHGMRNAVVVSTCAEISAPSRGQAIEINRIIDGEGKIVGIGARPGYPTLDEQINGIALIAGRKPIVLVEDGSFTGATMKRVVQMFQKRGIKIVGIVLGFVFPKAINAIREVFKGDILQAMEIKEDLIDWMPDHDFFPFAPNCGRTFGLAINGNAYPFYTHDGASYSVPYILPFAPMTDWTSIPKGKKKVGKTSNDEDVSIFCLQQAKELFEEIGKMNGRTIKIGELVGSYQARVSIPIAVGQKNFHEIMDKPIVEYLKDIYSHGILHLKM